MEGMSVTWTDDVISRVILVEYERIKEEQKTRIGFRDNLVYATFASMAGIIAATVSSSTRAYLLLLPPVSVVLGWTYLVNDEKISSIGRYIRAELAPRLTALISDQALVFGWETAHRSDYHRVSRKYLQLAVDLLTFCGAPFVAVVVYWSQRSDSDVLMTLSVVELVAVAVLGAQMVTYADLRRDSPAQVPAGGFEPSDD
jgi:hypothetical protein